MGFLGYRMSFFKLQQVCFRVMLSNRLEETFNTPRGLRAAK
jgi:hypothetical protein